MHQPNVYAQIIEHIFFSHYEEGAFEVDFDREEIGAVAAELGVKVPKNPGDVVYSFRFRDALPESIRAKAPSGQRLDHSLSRDVALSLRCDDFVRNRSDGI